MVTSLQEGCGGSSMVRHRAMCILQVSTSDGGGGAEKVAWNLFQAYRQHGFPSWLAVGCKEGKDLDVLSIPNGRYRSRWARAWLAASSSLQPLIGQIREFGHLQRLLAWIGEPGRWVERQRGLEDFSFPGTWQLLGLPPERPNIVHCHNLHGSYFDLRALPWLSQRVTTILTLHDAWLLSGHCAHSFDCERWKIGCGQCLDLTIYPAVKRDATAFNWQRKQDIYAKSRLYIATPSQWLMDKVQQSMLVAGAVECRVIPNGVDLSVFHPAERQAIRATLDMAQGAKVLLFAGKGIARKIWKDYQTVRAAVALVAERLHGQSVLFIALGEDAPAERIGQAEVRFVPYQKDPEAVARYYQAADVYIHAARAEAWGLTITEALACGTPVVATAVGGIPEQVTGLQVEGCRFQIAGCELNGYEPDMATGMLVPVGDAEGMAAGIVALLTDDTLRRQLGENATQNAYERFDLNRQVEAYLEWYQETIERENVDRPACRRAARFLCAAQP